ncbi:Ppx/GppA phosphatase family protein [Flexivirga oryzae]|uniref:Exopolyphosphatase/guanosine-5'-triphosphate, 3'-diphosphate pyrophosphatase n=1 Tax=Flexivirga oryzae TaxID=1794944 RepID=A0A839NCL0_9MICO|nr:Ppx/GppA phosphatase family protein [Flexivirga oryzae]MBB2892925.1 exopolyphosphatase/guanosine-5'-triphosphate,3'-diphosphate pyrophosphatase [Flexivirga oryzae]
MRLGVIDVGSNTVHLLVVDAHRGAHPLPAMSHKRELRLSEHTTDDGSISAEGVEQLTSFVRECLTIADDQGCQDLLTFATSAIREAPNGDAVLAQVHDATNVKLEVLEGPDESRLTFLAVRRWFGWSAGRLLVVDIGGGSLEFAAGIDEEPDVALSLPLGAGRLTRDLAGDPPGAADLKVLRKQIRSDIARVIRELHKVGEPDRVVGTSKTIRSLARVLGAAPRADGPRVERVLERDALGDLVPRLAGMTAAQRAELPGVSVSRARQLLAGAMVVHGAMELLGVDRLDLCPWALREGVILRRLDWLDT